MNKIKTPINPTSMLALGFAALPIFSCSSAKQAGGSSEQNDIVFILADDLGIGDVSCFNPDGKIPTPNLDRMAAEGIRFTDAHAASALSTPSRYAVLTGRYPWRTIYKQGVQDGFSPAMIASSRPTIGSMLSDMGYGTACIGKWHLGWHWEPSQETRIDLSKPISDGPLDRGFDYFFGLAASLDMAPYLFVENNMATETRIRQMPKDKGVHLIHGGMAGENFDPAKCLPELTRKAVSHILSWKGSKKPQFLYMPLTAPHTPCFPSEKFKGCTGLGDYADFVVMMDDAVGQVIEAVRKAGRLNRTVFVFASDNGCAPYAGIPALEQAGHFPSAGFRGYKADVYEGGHRIPLIISGKCIVPKDLKGSCCSSTVSLADLFSTFREIAGGPAQSPEGEAEDSYSIVPLIKGEAVAKAAVVSEAVAEGAVAPAAVAGNAVAHDAVAEGAVEGNAVAEGSAATVGHAPVIAVSGSGWFSIREGQYKLIFTPGSGGWSAPVSEKDCAGLPSRQLYDLSNDPGERNNLINEASLQGLVSELTIKLQDYIMSGRTTQGDPATNDTDHLWKQTIPIFD